MTRRIFTFSSAVPAHVSDHRFFQAMPGRQFLARDYVDGDLPAPPLVAGFGPDELDSITEVSLTVVKRIKGGRIRRVFATSKSVALKTDAQIREFLWSRGVDPFTMEQAGHHDD